MPSTKQFLIGRAAALALALVVVLPACQRLGLPAGKPASAPAPAAVASDDVQAAPFAEYVCLHQTRDSGQDDAGGIPRRCAPDKPARIFAQCTQANGTGSCL